jgi:hypothetical protein
VFFNFILFLRKGGPKNSILRGRGHFLQFHLEVYTSLPCGPKGGPRGPWGLKGGWGEGGGGWGGRGGHFWVCFKSVIFW